MFKITAYVSAGMTWEFQRDTMKAAREVANRIITEGLWVIEEDGVELFFPTAMVYKVKVEKVNAP